MKHNLKASSVFMGSMGVVVLSALSGCQGSQQEQAEPQNRFIVVEQLTSGKYVIVEETPTTGPSHAIIREKDENGTIHERVLSEEEMKQLAQQEYDKMQTGHSELNAQPQGEGMGLAGTILAAAGGALLGNMIGNALMNNANVRKHQEMSNRSAYYRSSGSTPSSTSSGTKKSFFGNNNAKSTSSSSSFGG